MFLTVENFVDCIHFPMCPITSGTARTFPHISTAAIWNLRDSRKYGNKKRGERQEDKDSVNYVCKRRVESVANAQRDLGPLLHYSDANIIKGRGAQETNRRCCCPSR